MTPRRIAVTMGDPAGIGPEICVKLLERAGELDGGIPVIFGDAAVLARVARHLGWPEPRRVLSPPDWANRWDEVREPTVLDFGAIAADAVRPGVVSADTGRASYRYIEASIEAALAGQVVAVTTGPVHKEALRAAGIPYPGHTEIYTAKTHAQRACMMLTSRALTCAFVTAHVGYREVPGLLSVARILDVLELTHEAMRRIRGRVPKIVVCGLNPHAGEHGLFGDCEEERWIIPAVEAARARGIDATGPLPPDTAFLAGRRESTDAFICMYHDQGHIPLKALSFETAVNITLGLPIIRTSVDHGTALDIAWQGRADTTSLIEAIGLARRLAEGQGPGPGAAS